MGGVYVKWIPSFCFLACFMPWWHLSSNVILVSGCIVVVSTFEEPDQVTIERSKGTLWHPWTLSPPQYNHAQLSCAFEKKKISLLFLQHQQLHGAPKVPTCIGINTQRKWGFCTKIWLFRFLFCKWWTLRFWVVRW